MAMQIRYPWLWAGVLLCSCAVDERSLSALFSSAQGSASGGADTSGPQESGAGDAGAPGEDAWRGAAGVSGAESEPAPEVTAGSAGSSASAGSGGKLVGSAGAASSVAGMGGTLAGAGGTLAGAGGTNAASGGISGTAGASAGTTGEGGGPSPFACGDIDQNKIDDCTETKVQNSRFDADVSAWSPSAQLQSTWDSRDARGKAGSGSMLISNVAPGAAGAGLVMSAAEQCVSVTGVLGFVVAARVFIPAGQGAGEGAINLWIFGGEACNGNFVSAVTPSSTTEVGSWQALTKRVMLPPGARSVLVRLGASKPQAQPKLDVLYDDVLLGPFQ